MRPRIASVLIVLCLTVSFGADFKSIKTTRTGVQTSYGLIRPLDQDGGNFYLQNVDGLIEIKLTAKAQIGLLFRERDIRKMIDSRRVTIRDAEKSYSLPKDLYVVVPFRDWRAAQSALKNGKFRDAHLSAKPVPDHHPTEDELWLSGKLKTTEKGHITPTKVLSVNGREFRGTTSGYNYAERIAGLFDHTDIQPFVQQASVHGTLIGDVFHADLVFLRPIPDQTANDDPNLPRYLFIGDSISGNYDTGLRRTLAGRFNIHHPPTNCGSSTKGRNSVRSWLGDFKTRGRHWDVISFNFGHWDSGTTKADYQANLENVIQQLKPTGAKLIWVSTCPVPNGYDAAGALKNGRAPGRTAGVMNKYLNPWALEVIRRHPEISICDQWQFVKDQESGRYEQWWHGKNVHFKGEPAHALGRMLGAHVAKLMDVPLVNQETKR
ncbi:MAG: hypothetical protein CMO80_13070 [Verrucomicrobiales bacterium]|nr:hypothetical protein [Verrucomicrobiales bacterium]|tara:strand:- start:3620 stop:4924 length:1305 start_codon:yes stop_codon:yes gene_type:complete